MNIEKLKERKNELSREIRKISNEIEDYQEKIQLPEEIERYKGKHYKFKNSYSCPKTESDYWYVYHKVVAVPSIGRVRTYSFYTDKYEDKGIEVKDIPTSVLGEEISEEEFNIAHEKFIDSIEDETNN